MIAVLTHSIKLLLWKQQQHQSNSTSVNESTSLIDNKAMRNEPRSEEKQRSESIQSCDDDGGTSQNLTRQHGDNAGDEKKDNESGSDMCGEDSLLLISPPSTTIGNINQQNTQTQEQNKLNDPFISDDKEEIAIPVPVSTCVVMHLNLSNLLVCQA